MSKSLKVSMNMIDFNVSPLTNPLFPSTADNKYFM